MKKLIIDQGFAQAIAKYLLESNCPSKDVQVIAKALNELPECKEPTADNSKPPAPETPVSTPAVDTLVA